MNDHLLKITSTEMSLTINKDRREATLQYGDRLYDWQQRVYNENTHAMCEK